jgi:uncharacterized membrane protein YhiD involved in acid resistance
VAVGAAAFTIVSTLGLGPTKSPMRIAAGVVTPASGSSAAASSCTGGRRCRVSTRRRPCGRRRLSGRGAGDYTLTMMIFVKVLSVQLPLQWVEHWIDRLAE